MESFLNRYRSITVLVLVIFAQLVLLAAQVKNDRDVRVIRVWAVSAVTPIARLVEGLRGGGSGFLHNYFLLKDTNEANRKLQSEVDRLKMENIFLKNELNTADRAKALQLFQEHTPSKTLAARIIAMGAGSNSKTVFVDRGTESGVLRGMAVVTPDGIVGKVIAVYPFSSEVQLVTDADFGAGVISQKTQVHATMKGQGTPVCRVDYVPSEEKVEPGDWFYTSGDDRIFPRGFPAGVVKTVRPAQPFKEIYLEPSGLRRGLEDALIVIQAVHQDVPDQPPSTQPVYLAPPPPAAAAQPQSDTSAAPQSPAGGTEADKLRTQYKALGDAQDHVFGVGLPGSKPPDFNMKLQGRGLATPPLPGQGPAAGGQGSGNGPAPGTAGQGSGAGAQLPVAGGRGPAGGNQAPAIGNQPAPAGIQVPERRIQTPAPGSQTPGRSSIPAGVSQPPPAGSQPGGAGGRNSGGREPIGQEPIRQDPGARGHGLGIGTAPTAPSQRPGGRESGAGIQPPAPGGQPPRSNGQGTGAKTPAPGDSRDSGTGNQVPRTENRPPQTGGRVNGASQRTGSNGTNGVSREVSQPAGTITTSTRTVSPSSSGVSPIASPPAGPAGRNDGGRASGVGPPLPPGASPTAGTAPPAKKGAPAPAKSQGKSEGNRPNGSSGGASQSTGTQPRDASH